MIKSYFKRVIASVLLLFPLVVVNAQSCFTVACNNDTTVYADALTCTPIVSFTAPTGIYICATTPDTFFFTGTIDTFTVPAGVDSVRIEVRGAEGGYNTSSVFPAGLGAVLSGTFTVTPGSKLRVLAGQKPSFGTGNGGGGGSFVTDLSNNPLIIAGGGAGSSEG